MKRISLRRGVQAAAVLAATVGIVAVNTGQASAATLMETYWDTASGCKANLMVVSNWSNGHDGVYGDFYGPNGVNNVDHMQCTEYLMRSTDGGAHWTLLSSYHYVNPYQESTTYTYYDGPGYLAKVCIEGTMTDGPVYWGPHCSGAY